MHERDQDKRLVNPFIIDIIYLNVPTFTCNGCFTRELGLQLVLITDVMSH